MSRSVHRTRARRDPRARFGLTLSNRGINLGLTTSDEFLDIAERAQGFTMDSSHDGSTGS